MARQHNTKELIFNSALDLFAVTGYDAVSVRQITRAVGIKESSFYNHFASKAELLDTMFNTCREIMQKGALDAAEFDRLTNNLDLHTILKKGIDSLNSKWGDPTAQKLYAVVSMEQYSKSQAGQIIIEEHVRSLKHVAKLFEMLQQKGKMKPGDPDVLAHQYAYSIRALHLDYGLRLRWGWDGKSDLKKMYEIGELFCLIWAI